MRHSFKRGSGPIISPNYTFQPCSSRLVSVLSLRNGAPKGLCFLLYPSFSGCRRGGCDGIRNARMDALLDAGGRAVGDSFSVVACMYKVL